MPCNLTLRAPLQSLGVVEAEIAVADELELEIVLTGKVVGTTTQLEGLDQAVLEVTSLELKLDAQEAPEVEPV